MWCDNFEHLKWECDAFTEVLCINIVFFKERRIHSRKSGLPLKTNFSKGGIKVLVDGVARVHATEARTYGIGVDCGGVSIDVFD